MSEAGERQRAKARSTPERAGRRPGAQRASASDGGGRRAEASFITDGSEAARRRAIEAADNAMFRVWRVRCGGRE